MGTTSEAWRMRLRRRLHTAVRRTDIVVVTALTLSIVTVGIALVTPGTLPLRASTGLVVGMIAWIAGMVLASFGGERRRKLDSPQSPGDAEPVPLHPPNDVRVRAPQRSRPRYLRTAGGARRHGANRSLRLRGDRATGVQELAAALGNRGEAGLLKLGVAPMDPHPASADWGEDLAEQFARGGRRVLLVDLREAADMETPGVTDVARGRTDLAEAVSYHETLKIARLGPGSDRRSAAVELGVILRHPPVNVDTVVVCLPPLGATAIPATAQVVDHLTFIAVRDHTRLDSVRRAADVAGADVEVTVALVDAAMGSPPTTARRGLPDGDESVWPSTGRLPPTVASADQQPTRSEVWGRELAHASAELDATLDPDAVDAEAVWAGDAEADSADEAATGAHVDPSVETPGIADVWGVDDTDPSRSMSPSAHPRDPHG